jgi:hypothetical protein
VDQNLPNLRQRTIKTSIEFIRAQRASLKAVVPGNRLSKSELRAAAEEYLEAAEPYRNALQGLRQYLLAAEQTEEIMGELDRFCVASMGRFPSERAHSGTSGRAQCYRISPMSRRD